MDHLHFTHLMDCCPTAIICLDQTGVIAYANAEAATILDQETSALTGAHFLETFRPESSMGDLDEVDHFEMVVGNGKNARYLACRVKHCTGPNCAPVAYIVTIEDRTALHRVHEERHRLMEMATIGEVLPGILHEFKNPLASIQALVELMTEDCRDEELQSQLHSILMEIRRMKLGFEGLGFSTRNLASTRCQAVDYGVREACTIFDRQLEARGIRLDTDIETMPLLPLDSAGIRGVLFNLLNNAKQACRPGDKIEVSAGLKEDGKLFYFSVRDTGPGMPSEVLAQCTNLFFTTKRMGSGIGLALCKTAVEKVGGELHITSTEGEGTCMTVSLPLSPQNGH